MNNNKLWMVRLRSFRQVTGLPRCVDQLSDGYLEYASESPYSVQNMANIRIRLIFDSSNTLVNCLGPTVRTNFLTTFSSREGINSQWAVLTAVVAVHVVAVPTAAGDQP